MKHTSKQPTTPKHDNLYKTSSILSEVLFLSLKVMIATILLLGAPTMIVICILTILNIL